MIRLYLGASPAAPSGPTGPAPESSAEPSWSFLLSNLAGVANTAGSVTGVTDQSIYAIASTATNAVTLDGAELLGGQPTLSFTAPSYVRFAEYIAVDTRPELLAGFALCAVIKCLDGNYDTYTANQGLYGDGFSWSALRYNTRFGCLENQGGKGTGFNGEFSQWSFRAATFLPGKEVSALSSQSNYETCAKGRAMGLTDPTQSRFTAGNGFLIGNRYTGVGAIDSKCATMHMAALGVVPIAQVDQCRRYWSTLYSTTL